jgi:hypothetical protein
MALKDIPGTTSVFAERTTGGYFLDFDIKRDQHTMSLVDLGTHNGGSKIIYRAPRFDLS